MTAKVWFIQNRTHEAAVFFHSMNTGELRRDFSAARLEWKQSSEALFKNFLRISGLLK
ncbi:MAG: hypothetical protein ABH891_08130 [Candidatus Omnitrophota bacterium]